MLYVVSVGSATGLENGTHEYYHRGIFIRHVRRKFQVKFLNA